MTPPRIGKKDSLIWTLPPVRSALEPSPFAIGTVAGGAFSPMPPLPWISVDPTLRISPLFGKGPGPEISAEKKPASPWVLPPALPPPPSAFGSSDAWIQALQPIANQIERLDVDFFNLPVNRGSGEARFSEYTPRAIRPNRAVISMFAGTTARAHGEIRPVAGSQESLITRVLWDFEPNVTFIQEKAAIPNLEIDGAAAVDPPIITFDRTFPHPKKIVKAMEGGDVSYENPMGTGTAWVSPFDSTAPTPPGGHKYWLFHFEPVNKNLISGIEESIAQGSTQPILTPGLGALYLWALLPTLGHYEDSDYEPYGIPFDTLPRRFGDLISLLAFGFDKTQRPARLEKAPMINPNSEYIDLEGKRQRIPEDPEEVLKINAGLKAKGYGEIGRNRGSIIDWFFTDLAKDPKRLKEMPDSKLPYLTTQLRMREGFLQLPIGKIHLDPRTDIKAKFYLRKIVSVDFPRPESRFALQLEITDFRLEGDEGNSFGVDLKIGDTTVQAKSLKARKAVIDIPDLDIFSSGPTVITDATPAWHQPEAMTVKLEGVELSGLELSKAATEGGKKDWAVQIGSASIGSLNLTREFRAWKATVEKFAMKGLTVDLNLAGLPIHQLRIPDTSFPRLDLDLNQDILGKIEKLGLSIPRLPSNLELSLGFGQNPPVEVKVSTSGLLKDIDYHFEKKQGKPVHRLGAELPSITMAVAGSILTVPLQSSAKMAIKNGRFGIDGEGTHLEGDLDLSATAATEIVGFGRGETKLGSFTLAKGSPRINNLGGRGHFRFDFTSDGYRLTNPQHDVNPLNIEFNTGIKFTHQPSLEGTPIDGMKESEIVKTDLDLQSTRGMVRDLRELVFRQGPVSGELTDLEIGSIFLSGLKGEGKIWAKLPIWGYVRLNLPSFGGSSPVPTQRPSAAIPLAPDSSPLLREIPPAVIAQLKKDSPGLSETEILEKFKGENFFLLDDVRYHVDTDGDMKAFLGDLILDIQEQPKSGFPFRGSFGMLRIPELQLSRKAGVYDFDLDKLHLFHYIFLNEPPRGGSFCIVKWPEPLKPANLCPTTK